jgi:hypothetical protein
MCSCFATLFQCSGEQIADQSLAGEFSTMTDFNRGIMKFKGADSPIAVLLSGVLIIGSIVLLVVWAIGSAYAI